MNSFQPKLKQVKFSLELPNSVFPIAFLICVIRIFQILLHCFNRSCSGRFSSIYWPVPSSLVWASVHITQLFKLKLQLLDPSKRGKRRSILNERKIQKGSPRLSAKLKTRNGFQIQQIVPVELFIIPVTFIAFGLFW